ncbi:MAG TPA: hypothetical protein VGZ22_02340, partial [Isosphaeraceae bacterium]|nr:hypothetical protein [Isosphaeraceae bacterium]
HQSFAEYLSAKYLVENHRLGVDTLLGLLVDGRLGRGRVIPQLRELAGWVAEMHPEVRRRLVTSDPQALLRSDLSAVSATEKEELTSSLLQGFASGEFADVDWTFQSDYHKLRHPGLAAQLEPYISDRTMDSFARRLAIDIARTCNVQEVQDLLATVALDVTESLGIRDDAARTVAKIADTHDLGTRRRLLPLAMGIGEDDPQDQLKGHALTALWPGGIGVREFLGYLTPPKAENFLGSYWAFLKYTAARRMPTEDLPVALEWAAQQSTANQRPGLGDLVDELLLAGARNLEEPGVRGGLSAALLSSMLSRMEVFRDTDDRSDFLRIVHQSQARRSLAQDIVQGITDRARQASNLHWLGLLGPEDLDWMLEQLHGASAPAVAEHWARLVRALYLQGDPQQVDAILVAAQTSPLLAEVFRDLLGTVDLRSEEAAQHRELYVDLTARPARTPRPRAIVQITNLDLTLERIESGEGLGALVQLNQYLVNYEGSRDALETDIARGAVWEALPAEMQRRILAATKRVLVTSGPAERSWLGANRIGWDAMAVYRALLLLTIEEPHWLAKESPEFWRKWAAMVIRFPIESDEKQPDLDLISLAYSGAPDEAIQAVLERIDEENEGDYLFVLSRLRDCWARDDRLCRELLSRLQHGGLKPRPFQQLLQELTCHECPDAARHAESLISPPISGDPEQRTHAVTAAVSLLTSPLLGAWENIWRLIREDSTFGREVLGKLAHWTYEKQVTHLITTLREDTIADLYLWMVAEFPPEEDPEHSGIVTERQAVAYLRDRLLQLLK